MKNLMRDLVEELNYEELYERFFFKTEDEPYSDQQIDTICELLCIMTDEDINDFIDYLERHYFIEAYDDREYIGNFIAGRKEEEEVL